MELALRMVSTSGPCKFGCAEEGGVVPLEFTTGSAHEMQPTKKPPPKRGFGSVGTAFALLLGDVLYAK